MTEDTRLEHEFGIGGVEKSPESFSFALPPSFTPVETENSDIQHFEQKKEEEKAKIQEDEDKDIQSKEAEKSRIDEEVISAKEVPDMVVIHHIGSRQYKFTASQYNRYLDLVKNLESRVDGRNLADIPLTDGYWGAKTELEGFLAAH